MKSVFIANIIMNTMLRYYIPIHIIVCAEYFGIYIQFTANVPISGINIEVSKSDL